MANRYWVGGTASWDVTAGTKWAATSGGAGGAAVPTIDDDVFFDAVSGAGVVTITAAAQARSLNTTGFTGTITGSSGLRVDQNLTLSSGVTFTYSGVISMTDGTGTATITTAGKTLGSLTLGGASSTAIFSLQDALVMTGTLTLTGGTFTTNNYNVTASSLASSNSNTRTINLGSSTVTLSGAAFVTFTTSTNLTFNAGTSSIIGSSTGVTLAGGGQTFYNVSFTSNAITTGGISGANTFNNLSVTGRTTAGVSTLLIQANQTINGVLTLSPGTNATMRTFLRAGTLGATWTLTCAAVTATDIDFRDITIAGAAAPVSGTRLGDCKGNSGITFPAAKTVYWRSSGGGSFSTAGWALSPTSPTGSTDFFPLAQDTVVFDSAVPSTGSTMTVNAAYNIGTIDMSARTSNTMTLATGTNTPTIYGNWINGTGTTLTGTGVMTFAGRGSQTITSAGVTFTQSFAIDTPSGSVALQDAFNTNRSNGGAITLNSGTFNANGYNLTLSGSGSSFVSTTSSVRTIAIGSGTWTIAGSATGSIGWNTSTPTNLTVTGTGTISLTSASAKTFAGGGIQTYPTINQGGTGTLTISGSNKFAGITNTAIGRVQFTGGTTNEFTSFTLSGSVGTPLQLGSTNTTQAILIKPTSWRMGLLSTDAGNNTGLTFLSTDGTMEYLSVSYINGQVSAAPTSTIYYGSTNVTTLYYGSTPVTSVYYGSTQVF